jgi:imidazolonepropionase-like amidohydrolase
MIEEGAIRGPNIYYAGDILSTTGGHADHHDVDLEHLAACDAPIGHLCDGVPECIKAVRLQLRKGATVIKVCASGGVMSKLDDPQHQQFSDEELCAIVEEAGRSEVIVAAHCHGKKGIMAALRAGCHTIEHGSYLDEEAVALMLEKGAILVGTRWIIERLKGIIGDRKKGDEPPPSLTQEQLNKVIDIYHDHKASMELAIKRGVPVALGTDMVSSTPYCISQYDILSIALRCTPKMHS